MSMDDPASSHDVRDTDMSEAAANDPELALGKSCCIELFFFMLVCTFDPSFFSVAVMFHLEQLLLVW